MDKLLGMKCKDLNIEYCKACCLNIKLPFHNYKYLCWVDTFVYVFNKDKEYACLQLSYGPIKIC